MPTYRLKWEIDIEADDPVAAAKQARATQLDPNSTAVVFEVTEHPTATMRAGISHGEIDLFEVSRAEKEQAADDAFERYDFGRGVEVVAHEDWNTDDSRDFTKLVYVTYPEDDQAAASRKVSFHVKFLDGGALEDVYALEMEHGQEIGCPYRQQEATEELETKA
jgi:hypothetical protein